MLLFSGALAAAALLGDVATLSSPCPAATAALLYKGKEADAPLALQKARGWHWCALELAEAQPTPTLDPALLEAPASVKKLLDVPDELPRAGAPLAVGRLRCTSTPPMIDCLCCALPKEDPQAAVQLGLVIDALLLVWAEHVITSTQTFEMLAASSSLAADEALRARGFVASDTTDFTALSRGESLVTHHVRQTLALDAAAARAATTLDGRVQSPFDVAHAQSLVDALRNIGSKVDLAGATEEETPKRRDPWAGIKGFGMS